jgi:FtsP/CotA-like multicopper oxidase with cupredoxin domain
MNEMATGVVTALGKKRGFLALLGFSTSIVYLLLGQHQTSEHLLSASAFLGFAAFQLLLALMTLFAPSRRIFAVGLVGNGVLLLGSLAAHIVGLPIGAHPLTPQIVGSAELSIFIMESLAIMFYFRLVQSTKSEKPGGRLRVAFVSGLSLLVVYGLTSMGITSVFAKHPEAMNMSAPVPPGQQPVSVTSLREAPGNQPIKNITLVAEAVTIDGHTWWTYNGMIPGPEIRVKQGDRLRVTFTNRLPVMTTVHWHGIRLPNAEDGVAGITQDAIKPGDTYTYEFVAKDAGTFMYHSHQDTFVQMLKGLYGALIVESASPPDVDHDRAIILHETPGDNAIGPGMNGYLKLGVKQAPAFNGITDDLHIEAKPGEVVRLRLIGAVQGEADGFPNYMIAAPREVVLVGAPFQVWAIDGNNINEPQRISAQRIPLGIGQRYDLVFKMPESGEVRLIDTRGRNTVTIGLGSTPQTANLRNLPTFDITTYGKPGPDPVLSVKNGQFDVSYPMILGFHSGVRDDRLQLVHTINGQDAPMMTQYLIKQGQVVRFHIVNQTEEFHVMHLHGHSFSVVMHRGKALEGSPIYIDSLLVAPHEDWDIAFVADNPGLWMVHCHVLVHAAFGMSAMASYEGITTPYDIGTTSGNKPE